jgi:hypothetical protein
MYIHPALKTPTLTLEFPRLSLWWLLARVSTLLRTEMASARRADFLHNVLTSEVVSAAGVTPSAYGWSFDPELQASLRWAPDPADPLTSELTGATEEAPPRGGIPSVYRVPRTRRSGSAPVANRRGAHPAWS